MPLLKTPPAITSIPRSRQSGSSSGAAERRRRVRPQEPADLRGEDELVARPPRERPPEPPLRESVAVERCGVEEANAALPRAVNRRERRLVVDRLEQPAERRGPEADHP